MLAEKVPESGDAFEVLKVVSRSKKTRRDYEIREKSLKDRASMKSWYMNEGMKKGIEEGVKKGREEGVKKGREEGVKKGREEGVKKGREDAILQTAKNLKNAGVVLDIISKSTGLSLDEIQKL
ncbi:MAG: hypothetical protein B0D92_02425 [Spirochaeta sp. LUC14_002_19_P3]|nr:MAG: hypothetical protein B0D92_02425 [Spirochaeta sp. LUC14_002_19_P3]